MHLKRMSLEGSSTYVSFDDHHAMTSTGCNVVTVLVYTVDTLCQSDISEKIARYINTSERLRLGLLCTYHGRRCFIHICFTIVFVIGTTSEKSFHIICIDYNDALYCCNIIHASKWSPCGNYINCRNYITCIIALIFFFALYFQIPMK